jgi:hypothetical protein
MENIFEIKFSATSVSSSRCVQFPEWPSSAILRWSIKALKEGLMEEN